MGLKPWIFYDSPHKVDSSKWSATISHCSNNCIFCRYIFHISKSYGYRLAIISFVSSTTPIFTHASNISTYTTSHLNNQIYPNITTTLGNHYYKNNFLSQFGERFYHGSRFVVTKGVVPSVTFPPRASSHDKNKIVRNISPWLLVSVVIKGEIVMCSIHNTCILGHLYI